MSDNSARLAVFVSGGGTNLQALIDAAQSGRLSAQIVWVVSSTRKAFGLQRAAREGIETFVFRTGRYASPEEAGDDLLNKLRARRVDFIALAGYLKLVPLAVVRAYAGRVVNIHPALLPRHGGKGMYGLRVHEAVLAAGDKETGPTVHLVDEVYDRGKVLEQIRIPVLKNDTAESLAARVLVEEHKLYPAVMEKLITGKYEVD